MQPHFPGNMRLVRYWAGVDTVSTPKFERHTETDTFEKVICAGIKSDRKAHRADSGVMLGRPEHPPRENTS
eukprot:scaffold22586_cov138-Cylindrotheca_fusiformis.AAC.12